MNMNKVYFFNEHEQIVPKLKNIIELNMRNLKKNGMPWGGGLGGLHFFLQSLRFLTELLTFYVIVLIKLGSSSSNTCTVYKPFIPHLQNTYIH